MDLQEFIDTNSKKKPNADIHERWQTRILPQRLHTQGEAGAQQYLGLYGKNIAAPKCIMFAVLAQQNGYNDMALGFWKKAFQLETGLVPGSATIGVVPMSKAVVVPPSPKSAYLIRGLQPGEIVTMQPEDGLYPRQQYLERDEYWSQAKRDGNKVLVFAAPDGVWYQSRSMKLRADPCLEMTKVLRTYAGQHEMAFILEGELYFLDYQGKEHRTGAQAAKANILAGKGETAIPVRYMPFYAICESGHDWREDTYAIRILYGTAIANGLAEMSPMFVVPVTARTYNEKAALAHKQYTEGREGEVYFRANARYHAGKDKSEDIIRKKYMVERNARVTGLTRTTAENRLFGAIQICDPSTGDDWGTIGTGFDHADQEKIVALYRANPDHTILPMVCQGWTEDNKAFLARLSEDF